MKFTTPLINYVENFSLNYYLVVLSLTLLFYDNSVLLALVISPSDSMSKAYWWRTFSDRMQACDTFDELTLSDDPATPLFLSCQSSLILLTQAMVLE